MPTYKDSHLSADTAEALSRRAEAEANVLRSQGHRGLIPEDAGDARGEEAGELYRRALEMRPSNAPDPEGTAVGLADRRGNYASTVDIANQGGIGVFDSNSREMALEESTPNARLHAGTMTTNVDEDHPLMTSDDKLGDLLEEQSYSEEDQEAYDRQRAFANMGVMPSPEVSSAYEAREARTSGKTAKKAPAAKKASGKKAAKKPRAAKRAARGSKAVADTPAEAGEQAAE